MHVAQQGQRAGVVPARRQPEVVLRLVVVLLEALDAEEVALANCCGHGGVATRGNLHEEVHLGGTDDLAVSLVQVEAHELHGLRHALAVDARDALRHVDVVQGRRGAGLRHAVAVQVPVAHGHERPRVAGRGGRVEVQHRQGLALPEVFARHLQGREEHAEVVLCVGVARVRSALEERRGLREAPGHARAHEVHLAQRRAARGPRRLPRPLGAAAEERQSPRVLSPLEGSQPSPQVAGVGLALLCTGPRAWPLLFLRVCHSLQRHRELQQRDLRRVEQQQQRQ
mmetsp:Transcript_24636/g.76705  ORF Transcript_24636/g.76705 Transcript_24636/m.76705 type:complete len:283 (-) Transcript_24636:75-923(-)